MSRRQIENSFFITLFLLIALGMAPNSICAQGTLVFEDPFEFDTDVPGWYVAGGGGMTVEGSIEVGAGDP